MAMASRCGATRATGAARAARAAQPRAVSAQPRRAVASAAAKSILFDQESRTKLQAGIDKVRGRTGPDQARPARGGRGAGGGGGDQPPAVRTYATDVRWLPGAKSAPACLASPGARAQRHRAGGRAGGRAV